MVSSNATEFGQIGWIEVGWAQTLFHGRVRHSQQQVIRDFARP